MEAFAVLALFVLGGLFTYAICEQRHRHRWGGRAPDEIHLTALWSIYMGQMALPGGLIGFLGLFVFGIGLVSIPGMILAIRIWRLGYAMLRRDPDAALEANRLRWFAVILNIVTVTVALAIALYDPDFVPMAVFFWVYAIVSFTHAWALGRCAETLAAADREEARLADQRRADAELERAAA